jgi:hypothetical protein
MLPYPLAKLSDGGMFYKLKDTFRKPGTSFRRIEHWKHVRKLKSAGNVNEVADLTEQGLRGKMDDHRLDQILTRIKAETNLDKAKEIGNATMTYSFLDRDIGTSPVGSRYRRVLDSVGTQLEGGNAGAMKMDNVVRTMNDIGEADAKKLTLAGDTAGAAQVKAETESMITNYVKDNKFFHNVYGDEKAEFFSLVNGNRRVTADWMKNVSPAERQWLAETHGGIANCEYSLDLGSNLHARMMLEDYMGIGPRPSEFYHGLGPDTREEWAAERARLAEGDADTWERV